jgi:hypothetical protein
LHIKTDIERASRDYFDFFKTKLSDVEEALDAYYFKLEAEPTCFPTTSGDAGQASASLVNPSNLKTNTLKAECKSAAIALAAVQFQLETLRHSISLIIENNESDLDKLEQIFLRFQNNLASIENESSNKEILLKNLGNAFENHHQTIAQKLIELCKIVA